MSVVIDAFIFHRNFGDLHSHSIDEPYYRSAVLQHEYDPKAYVFSVPFDAGNQSLTAVAFHNFVNTFFFKLMSECMKMGYELYSMPIVTLNDIGLCIFKIFIVYLST